MLLAIDVGNTNMVLGLFSGTKLEHSWRLTTLQKQTADELMIQIRSLFALRGVEIGVVDGIAISSVVPPMDTMLRHVCESFFKVRPVFVEPGIRTGLPILTDSPAEAGADRIVNCIAAYEKLGGPSIVVDLGTATTFDVVSAKGEFLGGAIAPGIGISADALFRHAARLSRVDIRKPAKIIGTNTTDNIQIGLYYGYIGLVDGILERMIGELGTQTNVVATGGLAELIAAGSKFIGSVEPMLTLDGLRILFERNRDRLKRREMSTATQA